MLVVLLIMIYPFSSSALDFGKNFTNGPWNVTSNRMTYDNDLLILEGDVEVVNEGERLRANKVVINMATKEVEARGDVKFESKEGTLRGAIMKFHFGKGTGKIEGGRLFFQEDNIYLSGDTIEKTAKDTYHITNGSVTTCDGESPAWSLGAKDIDVTIGGYARAKNATLRVKSIPFAYAPYLIFPASQERRTGFLIPKYDHSDRDGFGLDLPFYWAINESSDATFYEHYMSERGFMQGIEYRRILSEHSKGTISFDYLNDDVDGSEFDEDGFIRTNRDRWWVRGKADQLLPKDFALKVDLDLVSDEDYLREFRRSYSAFDASQRGLLGEFGRGLDEETSLVRRTSVSLNRDWEKFNLNGRCQYNQNLDKGQNEFTLHALPAFQLSRAKRGILNTPLLGELDSSYINYWRNIGGSAHRLDIYPRLDMPFRFGNYVNFVPSVGFRETAYIVDKPGTGRDFKSREQFDLRSELSTNFSRIFNLHGKRVQKLRHAIQPKVIYEYGPDTNQELLPQFDGIDHPGKRNIIHYSITNYLIGKLAGDQDQVDHLEFLRLTLSQGYDVNKTFLNRSFSDIMAEIELTPLHFMVLDIDTSFSPYDSEFTSYNIRTHLLDKRGDSLNLDYRYEDNSYKLITPGSPFTQSFRAADPANLEEINTDLTLKISDTLSFLGGYRRSLFADMGVETRLGLSYKSQCWGMDLHYIDEYEDQRFMLRFSLTGIGDFKF